MNKINVHDIPSSSIHFVNPQCSPNSSPFATRSRERRGRLSIKCVDIHFN